MPEPTYTPYTPVATVPTDAQGNRWVNPWHTDDNLTYVQGMLERLARALFATGGVVLPGTVALSGTTLTVTGPRLGVSADCKLVLLVDPSGGGVSLDVLAGSPPSGKHTVCVRAVPAATAAHSFTSPATGETVTDTMTLTVGVLGLVQGSAGAYPALPPDAVPVANVTVSGGAVTLDAVLDAPPLFQPQRAGPALANPAASGAVNLALNLGRLHDLTLTGNVTLSFSGAGAGGGEFRLVLRQDATGGRAVTWPASVKWPGGAAPALGAAAGAVSLLRFVTPDGATWFGVAEGINFA
jgi:hypothetical protein